MDPRASGGVHITRDLLGLWQLELAAVGGNVCLAEHPTPRLVTDNLDNFSNRADRHRLSIPSTPQDKATPTLSVAPTLPCRGYRGYRSYQLPKPTKEESHENRF